MPNKHRGEITIELGEYRYPAAPTYKALAEIESTMGPLLPVAQQLHAGNFGLREVCSVLTACIRAACDNPKDAPTYDEIAELVVEEGLNVTGKPVQAMIELVAAYLSPKSKDEGKAEGSPSAP